MNYADDDLQHRIEQGQSGDDSVDAKAYQHVFQALNKDPYSVPPHFADAVMQRLESKKTSSSKDYLWFATGLLVFLIAAAITIRTTGVSIDFYQFRSILSYSGILIFGLVFIFIIQYLDRILVTRQMDL
jgi:hypothetical protein